MSKKHTIYDVARNANVAISTVSRVLNKSPYVSFETRQRVQKAIDELNFSPQVNARKLARREAQVIAVALPTFTTPFFNEVLKGVKDQLQNTDLDFYIYNTGSENPEETFRKFLDRGIPDALIILSITIDEATKKRLLNAQIPVVIVGTSQKEFDSIYWNNYRGGYLAGEHLIREGYKKIGMVRSHSKSPVTDLREKGFRDVLIEHNLPLDETFFVTGITRKHAGHSEEAGYEAVQIMKERGGLPEAIFCTNDAQAIGVLHALKEQRLRAPEDVAVMGYDNIKTARYIGLSSIDQQMYDVGVMAINRMINLIKTKNIPLIHKEIEPRLVIRDTTRKL